MKQSAEFEAKALVSETDFYKLLRHYPTHAKATFKQTNYYFDTTDHRFKNQHSALRIRQKEQTTELTAKIKTADHHQELTLPLTAAEFENILTARTLTLPHTFKKKLAHLGHTIDKPVIKMTEFTTYRSEFAMEHSILFFDHTQFQDHEDFEIEVEATSTQKAVDLLHLILKTYDVSFTPSRPKIARALETH